MTTATLARPLSATGMALRARELIAADYGADRDVQELNRELVASELPGAGSRFAAGGGRMLADGTVRGADGSLGSRSDLAPTRRGLYGPPVRWLVAQDPFLAHVLRDLLPGDEWTADGSYPRWLVAARIAELILEARGEGRTTPREVAQAWARQHGDRP